MEAASISTEKRSARETGIYNANELRKFEMQNPRTDPGGEKYFEPANMQPTQNGQPAADSAEGVNDGVLGAKLRCVFPFFRGIVTSTCRTIRRPAASVA